MAGTTCFTPAPGGLRYTERGTLIFGGYRGDAVQNYTFALITPGVAAVAFEDGRPFHTLDLTAGRTDIIHACAPDWYCGRYRVECRESWSLAWIVTGPRKNLSIVTRYRRA